jgi:hypothetical protein
MSSAQPIIAPGGTDGPQITQAVRLHSERLRKWREHTNIHDALKKQPIYLRTHRDHHVGRNICLTHTHVRVTPQYLQANQQPMLQPWDPTAPFKIHQIEEAQQEMGDV